MTTLKMSDVREKLSECANEVAYKGERITVDRNGKPVFVMISVEDLELLELLEDKLDIFAVEEALKRNDFVGLDELKKRLDL
ncbi:MAG: type II toxin-antitoxin system prevent-host-death family antitoxin [Planctomycetota bacterium]